MRRSESPHPYERSWPESSNMSSADDVNAHAGGDHHAISTQAGAVLGHTSTNEQVHPSHVPYTGRYPELEVQSSAENERQYSSTTSDIRGTLDSTAPGVDVNSNDLRLDTPFCDLTRRHSEPSPFPFTFNPPYSLAPSTYPNPFHRGSLDSQAHNHPQYPRDSSSTSGGLTPTLTDDPSSPATSRRGSLPTSDVWSPQGREHEHAIAYPFPGTTEATAYSFPLGTASSLLDAVASQAQSRHTLKRRMSDESTDGTQTGLSNFTLGPSPIIRSPEGRFEPASYLASPHSRDMSRSQSTPTYAGPSARSETPRGSGYSPYYRRQSAMTSPLQQEYASPNPTKYRRMSAVETSPSQRRPPQPFYEHQQDPSRTPQEASDFQSYFGAQEYHSSKELDSTRKSYSLPEPPSASPYGNSYHRQFQHGVSSVSGHFFLPPLELRPSEGGDKTEGLCHSCGLWLPYQNHKQTNSQFKGPTLWYRHSHSCHAYFSPKREATKQVRMTGGSI
ncbi:hypothetical protein MNV49_000791 [Pseudohyphozyma bogoriensis]|nr:hypothetical protein MNV49_000791 [Pseudohyphozyma bogoriensis]